MTEEDDMVRCAACHNELPRALANPSRDGRYWCAYDTPIPDPGLPRCSCGPNTISAECPDHG